MDRARHQRAKDLFLEARNLSESERGAFLDQACAGDDALREDVASLLTNDSEAFLGTPPFPVEAAQVLPSTVGPFRVLDVLGEGGMGTVYRAQQQEPRREVALKVMRPGLATPSTLRRFQNEVELLGQLDHPGIARIFQAGTSGDQPYFAMELVEGRPLGDAGRALDTRQRIELLVEVCQAVEHAHTRGIVHRDLKPENILIDDAGRPRVLDFGVARAIDPVATAFTHTGLLIGTLRYMSPEQAAGSSQQTDVRTDVYSLGVIGYELLAGRLPYDLDDKTLPETVQVIRTVEPAPLGTAAKSYEGDLETIFARALEKEPDQRYPSVAAFASDLLCYLRGDPIQARPLTGLMRLQRWLRRHRTLVVAVAIAATGPVFALLGQAVPAYLALLIGLGGTVVGWTRAAAAQRKAESARRAAEREAEKANAILAFLQQMLASVDPAEQGHTAKVADVLDHAAQSLPGSFAGQSDIEGALRLTLGRSYRGLGLYDAARRELEAALDLCTRTLGPHHDDSLNALGWLCVLLREQGKQVEAEPLETRLVALRREHLGPDHPETLTSLGQLSLTLRGLGRTEEAIAVQREALDGLRRSLGDRHPETCDSMGNLAGLLMRVGQYDEAESLLRHTVDVLTQARGAGHLNTLAALSNLGVVLHGAGKLREAESAHRRSLRAHCDALGDAHPSTMFPRLHLGRLLASRGKHDEAAQMLVEARNGFAAAFDADHEANRAVAAAIAELQEAQRAR